MKSRLKLLTPTRKETVIVRVIKHREDGDMSVREFIELVSLEENEAILDAVMVFETTRFTAVHIEDNVNCGQLHFGS